LGTVVWFLKGYHSKAYSWLIRSYVVLILVAWWHDPISPSVDLSSASIGALCSLSTCV